MTGLPEQQARFSLKALCIHTVIALNLFESDNTVYVNLIT